MGKRHESIGIKQIIRYEWMEKTTNMMLAGIGPDQIRKELHEALVDCMGDGTKGDRSEKTRIFLVNNLMHIWVAPPAELIHLRDLGLANLQRDPAHSALVHWGMVSAVYPFWFNVAIQTGRLLNLQGKVSQKQIMMRLKERYGDRETVSRYARYVIRSFVSWKALVDSDFNGFYEKPSQAPIGDPDLILFLLQSVLHAIPEGKLGLNQLLNNPGIFPYKLRQKNIAGILAATPNLDILRHGLDEDLVMLRN